MKILEKIGREFFNSKIISIFVIQNQKIKSMLKTKKEKTMFNLKNVSKMKNLKVMMMTLMMCLMTIVSFGQLHIDSFYMDKTQNLIYSEIQEFDSLSQEQINTKVKNWAGTKFVNMKEVLVSETKEQLVFNYITETFYIKTLGMSQYKTWYIRMVIQIKDNKIKVSLFDDGNGFWAGSYSGGVSVPSVQARRYRFSDYFGKEGTCRKMYNGGLENIKESCMSTTKSLIKSLTENTKNQTDNDW